MHGDCLSDLIQVLEEAAAYSKRLNVNEELIRSNHRLCQEIVRAGLEFYGIGSEELSKYIQATEAQGVGADRISMSQALKYYVRDWSCQGVHERNTFGCIVDTMRLYAPGREERAVSPVQVLVPGTGLGRLGYDIVALGGYYVPINEWSTFMNVAYRLLELYPNVDEHLVHPFIDGWSHHANTADQHMSVTFPDEQVKPSAILLVEDVR